MLRLIYMRSACGFTLVEILVVLAIMGIIGMMTYLNIGTFREDENLKSVASDLQSYLRLAQSNATTGIKCGLSGGVSWVLLIKDRTTLQLRCQTQTAVDPPIREWTIKNPAQIDAIEGVLQSTNCASSFTSTSATEITVTFSYLLGNVVFSDSDHTNTCLSGSTKMRIKVRKNAESPDDLRTVTINKGGSIDVQ